VSCDSAPVGGMGSVESLARSVGALGATTISPQANYTQSQTPIGTGFGEATSFSTSTTTFERLSDVPDAVLTLIYDSLSNLARLGVPTESFRPKNPVAAPRNAFPASPTACPVPPGWSKK
jgi:hypothetical protein